MIEIQEESRRIKRCRRESREGLYCVALAQPCIAVARNHGFRAPAGTTATTSPNRPALCFHVYAERRAPGFWTPAGDGESYEITPHLKLWRA